MLHFLVLLCKLAVFVLLILTVANLLGWPLAIMSIVIGFSIVIVEAFIRGTEE